MPRSRYIYVYVRGVGGKDVGGAEEVGALRNKNLRQNRIFCPHVILLFLQDKTKIYADLFFNL